MKFYFDGDSFTNGGGLKQKQGREDTRWTKLVCNYFGAEEINLSKGGASNDAVMRHIFSKPTTEVYDFYFLQTTFVTRNEFYDEAKRKWLGYSHEGGKHGNIEDKCISRWGDIEGPQFAQWINFGLSRIYTNHYGKTRESVAYHALKAYVASVGRARRSFFSTTIKPKYTDNKYDMYFRGTDDFLYDKIPDDGHPSVEGHKTIAKYVIDRVSERLSDEGSVC